MPTSPAPFALGSPIPRIDGRIKQLWRQYQLYITKGHMDARNPPHKCLMDIDALLDERLEQMAKDKAKRQA